MRAHRYKILALIALTQVLMACQNSSFDPNMAGQLSESDEVSAEKSSMTVTSHNVADGITAAVVELKLRTKTDKPVVGLKLSLTASGRDNVIIPCTVSDANGMSWCRVLSTYAEVKELKTWGPISLMAQARFEEPRPLRSSFAVVSSGWQGRLPSGHRIISNVGVISDNTILRNSFGVKRAHTSINGALFK